MLSCREIKLEGEDWDTLISQSSTASFFQTKKWLALWLKHFDGKSKIIGAFDKSDLIGIAPFHIKEGTISFLGTGAVLGKELVSDFGDIIAPFGREKEVWETVIKGIKNNESEIRNIGLNFIREDSPSFKILKELGGKAEEVDVAPYIDLPGSWDDYLMTLGRHDRHELRRKMRKLESGNAFKICTEGNGRDIDEFLRLMSLSNDQKRDFLSEKMRIFFTDIAKHFGLYKILQLYFLKLNNINIAAVMTFKFKTELLLYNSGFDPEYSYLSPGLILKAFVIKQAIEGGLKKFDFLRGGEKYKYDLGGKERKLYKINI
jgi:hypothetical protein